MDAMVDVMTMAVAITHISMVMSRIGLIVDRGGRNIDRRRCHENAGRAIWSRNVNRRWSGDDYCRKWNADIDAKRYAGMRCVGACGSEGDGDCTEQNYLFHSYQFDGLFTGMFIDEKSAEVAV